MIHLPASVRVYLCLSPCDMRKSFDGLHALVRDHLELDAYAGHLVAFASRMVQNILPPGMQYAHETDVGAQMFRISRDLQQFFRAGTEQQIVQRPLVGQRQRGKLVWKCKALV